MFGNSRITIYIEENGSDVDLYQTVNSILMQTGLSRFTVNLTCSSNVNGAAIRHDGIVFEKAKATDYVLRLRAGDLISRSFLYKGFSYLLLNPEDGAVCPELSLQFDGGTLMSARNEDGIIVGQIGALTSPNLENGTSVFSKIIPDTCIIKKGGMLHNSTVTSFLPKMNCLAVNPEEYIGAQPNLRPTLEQQNDTAKVKIKKLVKKSRVISKLVRPIVVTRRALIQDAHDQVDNKEDYRLFVSELMEEEIISLTKASAIADSISNMHNIDVTELMYQDLKKVYSEYVQLKKYLRGDRYDYILVVPWLIHGGADLFAINYANEVARQYPNKRVLIITTSPLRSTLSSSELNLHKSIEILNLSVGRTTGTEEDSRYICDLLYSFVNNLQPKILHVLMSKSGYDMLIKYGDEIRGNEIKIIMSAYNYLVDNFDRWIGYAVEELPMAYRKKDLVSTDNTRMIEIWKNSFGIRARDIRLHRQRFDVEKCRISKRSVRGISRILWAAHIRKEKNPEMVVKIARLFPNIQFDCYGAVDPYEWPNGNPLLQNRLKNLHYMGEFSNFFNDINLDKYDAFLYTTITDGTPNILVESALAGLPIITPSVGGITGLLSDDTGFLVSDPRNVNQFGSTIKYMIDNPDIVRERTERLNAKVRKDFSIQNFKEQVSDMLKWGEYGK